jgi:hypothetical protein
MPANKLSQKHENSEGSNSAGSNSASLTSPTMDQAPLHFCRDCSAWKPKDQIHLRQKDDRFGCKGEPTGRCTSCTTRNHQRRQDMKRKRADDPSEVSAEPSPPRSIEQFTTVLHQQAHTDNFCCRARVSTEGLAGNEDDLLKVLAGRVWEATGFRFMCVWFPPEGQELTLSNIRLDLDQVIFIRM